MRIHFKTKFSWGIPTNFIEKITRQPGYWPKLTTIRDDPHNRWKIGMKMDMVTGSRFKSVLFHSEVCKSVQKLAIIRADCTLVFVDNRKLGPSEVVRLALNDGFDSTDDFFRWFSKTETDLKIIHWTDLKY
jgi:hypothetical protein